MSNLINSLIESLESDAIVSETSIPAKGIRQVIFDIVKTHNESLPEVRQTSVDTAYEVAERSLVASSGRNTETRKFLIVRDVTNFLSLAATGVDTRGLTEHLDLLPTTHPISTAPHSLTAAGLRHARARWISADPRIDGSVVSLVASAYSARPESAERVYLFARMSAAGSMIPQDIKAGTQIEALIAAANPFSGGNSRMARSLRAKAQRRDSKGRFAGVGGGVRVYVTLESGETVSVLTNMVGTTNSENTIEVGIYGDPNIPDGVYTVDVANIQALKAVLKPEDVADLPAINAVDQTIPGIAFNDLIATRKEAPTGWNLDPNYKKQSDSDPDKRYISEDGYIIDFYENYSGKKSDPAFAKAPEIEGGAQNVGESDGKFAKGKPVYVLKRDAAVYKGEGKTEVVARVQNWGQVQVAARDDAEKFDKAISDAPDDLNAPVATETYTGDDYVKAVAAKSKKNIQKIDEALKTLSDSMPQNKSLASFMGGSSTPIEDRIKSLADGASNEDITTQIMAVGYNLPANPALDGLRKAITDVVDSTIELEDKDLKKAKSPEAAKKSKGEVKAKLLKTTPEVAPSQLDGIDATPTTEAPAAKQESGNPLIPNDPDLSIQYGLGIDPYIPIEDKSALPEGTSDEPQFIADNFNKFALEGGLRLALNKGDSTVRLQMKDSEGNDKGPAYTVEADAVRDALQLQGVDTNKVLADLAAVSATEEPAPTVSKASVAKVLDDASLIADLSGYKKVGGAQGSNDGGTYEDANGDQIYAKVAQSELHADNEVLAAALYEVLGVDTAKLRKGILADGTQVVFSPMIPDSKKDLSKKLDDEAYLSKIQEGFAVDAWLANWDVAGTGFDNIVSNANGEPVRVDSGGALLFRAQGEPKGSAFGKDVVELDTLVNGKNKYSAAVFGNMSEEDKAKSAELLQKLSEPQIDKLVNGIMSSDSKKAAQLADTLKARRKAILEKYNLPTEPSPTATTTKGLESIVSRTGANGGGTIDFVDGSSPAQGFIVAMEPDVKKEDGTLGKREEVVKAEDFFDAEKGREILKAFALKNADKLQEDGFFLGTWHNTEDGNVYLDVSEVATSEEDALKLADARGELSVYDISTGNYVYTEKGKAQNGEPTTGTEQSPDAQATQESSGDDAAGAGPVGGDEPPADSGVDAEAAPEGTPELTGYEIKQDANGVNYPAKPLTSDDLYALRNGEKVPPALPFTTNSSSSGDALYFDSEGKKRWGKFGAAGALIRRKKDDGSYEYLVVKRNAKAATDGDIWSIPGGAHDSKEDATKNGATSKRELSEELGWKLGEDVKPSGTYTHQASPDWAFNYDFYDVNNQEIDPKLSKELTESKWVSADELKAMSDNGELHQEISSETLGSVLDASNGTDFAPTDLKSSKWWTPELDESGTQKPFRKDKASSLKKGDIVTVKGSTGERDVIVATDPIVEDGKVKFDYFNPFSGNSNSYSWDENSEAVILSDNKSAQDELAKFATPEAAKPAEAVPAVEPTTVEKSQAVSLNVENSDASLSVSDLSDGGTAYSWGSSKANVYSSANNTFDAVAYDSNENKQKANFASSEDAKAWVGDIVAGSIGSDTNPVTGKPVGEASKDVTVHKGGYVKPATEPQLDAIKKMLEFKVITPERKQEIANILAKDDLVHGEAGQIIGELKKAEDLPEPESALPEGDKEQISVGNGEITKISASPNGMPAQLFYDSTNNPIGAVMQSPYKSNTWTTVTQDAGSEGSTAQANEYSSMEAALDAFGAYHADKGNFTENPFGLKSEEAAPEAQTPEDQIVNDENNNLTPKDPTDILDPNLIMDAVKANHEHEVMPNGDLKIGESTYTQKIGDKTTYKYEAYVRRTKFERFYAYVVETNMTTGEKRVLKIGKREHHSYKALSASIAKAKAGVGSSNPRTFFQHDKKKIQPFLSVSDSAETDVTASLVSYLKSPDGPKTAAQLSNAIAEFFGDMTNGNYTVSKEVLDAMAKDAGLSPSFVNDVLDIMATNKAKSAASLPDSFFGPGGLDVPSKPHLSYDGSTIVSKGDYVDWTDQKTGKVYRGYVVNVRYMHDSKKYLYSDQTLAIFPELNAEQGYESTRQRHRVSSNLVVVDKSAPMTEPFYPKSKEAVSQEDVTNGKTAEYVPAPKAPATQPKAPTENTPSAPAAPQQTFEEMYGGPDHNRGDSITNPATGVTGEVTASWVGPSGIKGFTLQTKDGQKINVNNSDYGYNDFQKQEALPKSESAKPVQQNDNAPEVQMSETGHPYIEIDGVKHPLYEQPGDAATAAILGTNTPKKWSQVEAGDLLHVGDKWTHVVSAGTGEDGVFRIVTSMATPDGHQIKVISIDESKKAFLDLQAAAVVVPENPMVPGAVELDKVFNANAPAEQDQIDKLNAMINDNHVGKSSQLEEKLAGVVTKQLFGGDITAGEVQDAIESIDLALTLGKITAKKNDTLTAEEVSQNVAQVADDLSTSSIADAVADVSVAVQEIAPSVVEPEKLNPEFNDGFSVKIIDPSQITIAGGKKALFTKAPNKMSGSKTQVGDILVKGVGKKTVYYQVVELNAEGKRSLIRVRRVLPTHNPDSVYYGDYYKDKQNTLQTIYGSNTYKVYKPTQALLDTGYLAPTPVVTPDFKSEVVGGIQVQASQAAVTSLGVNKKSEAGNAQFGITGEISDLPYNYMPTSVSDVSLWKEGFDSQKVKTANSKYVITGAVITSTDGSSTGIVTDTDKSSDSLSVAWVHGPMAGQTQSGVLSNTVNDTESWVSPDGASSIGVQVNTEKIDAGKKAISNKIQSIATQYADQIEAKKKAVADQLAAEKLKKQIAAKKSAAQVSGSGAEIIGVAPITGWDESAYSNLPSLTETLDQSVNKTGLESSFGQDVLVDSDSVEDNILSVSAVEKGGKAVTKLNFTLTSWTLDDPKGGEGFLSQLEKTDGVKKHSGLKVQALEFQDDTKLFKALEGQDVSYQYVGSGNGTTYEVPLKDASGNQIGVAKIFRADSSKTAPNFIGVGTTSSSKPLAFHNKVEVVFDKVASPEDIETALSAVGVKQVRPATTLDTQVMLENKIISLFGDKPDGTKNISGELRQEILDSVKAQYGFIAADMLPRIEAGNIHFLTPDASAKQLASSLSFTKLRHGFQPPSWANKSENAMAQWLYTEFFGNGSGGLRSAADRALHGIYTAPGSGTTDVMNTGGAYVFVAKNSGGSVGSGRPVQFYMKPESIIAKLNVYGNSGDAWGKLNGNQISTLAQSSLAEIMVKGEIPYADMEKVQLSNTSVRNAVIAYFQQRGVSDINGTPIAQFFTT